MCFNQFKGLTSEGIKSLNFCIQFINMTTPTDEVRTNLCIHKITDNARTENKITVGMTHKTTALLSTVLAPLPDHYLRTRATRDLIHPFIEKMEIETRCDVLAFSMMPRKELLSVAHCWL